MNLPDNLGGKKKGDGGSGVRLNEEIINDMKKKNLLNRINTKFSPAEQISQKPAHELHGMKLMVPAASNGGGQRDLDDDELNALLNGGNVVQPGWSISGTRETQYVPTATAGGFDDDDDED